VSTQASRTAVGAHLVGGLKAPDAETAMRTTAGILGRHLYAISDGETGARDQWIGWQLDKLAAIDGIEMAGTHGNPNAANSEYSVFPIVSVADSVKDLPLRALGYADAAEQSYSVFRRLRGEGVIPEGVRFQVSVPTPYAVAIAWIGERDRERFFPIYAEAMAAEVAAIAETVGDDLLLQHDVAIEIGVLTGNFTIAGDLGEEQGVVRMLREVLGRAPDGVEQGVHFCYGDYKHRHFSVPEDLSLCVRLANALSDVVSYVHMPADRDAGRDPKYFEPLRDLSARRLALGVIDYEGDEDRVRELISAADTGSGGVEFAVATECGMARIDERGPGGPSLERLLELHAQNAAPLR
jgi:hypothetical protein